VQALLVRPVKHAAINANESLSQLVERALTAHLSRQEKDPS
jgi:hypothetical protein